MRLILFYLLIMFLPSRVDAQSLVSTSPENKNFLIEKGTGHVCGSCPGIEALCDSVIESHPGRGMLVLYHFGPDAVPQAGGLAQDFTTPYGDTIYDPAKLGWPFYLNMMVNRRDQGIPYGSTFIFGTSNQVQEEADTVVNQPSCVNLGMSSTFDSTTRLLTINVELYYTSTSATSNNFLQIVLTEDSIIGMQYDGVFNPSYVFMNTFRDNINGFSGDTIATTNVGTFISRTYTYTIPLMYKNIACDPSHCNLTMYIAEEAAVSGQQSFTGKIITATRSHIGNNTATAISNALRRPSEILFPNPSSGLVVIKGIEKGTYFFEVTNLSGSKIYSGQGVDSESLSLDLSDYPNGIYMIKVRSEKGVNIHKMILEK